jgi:hypothetical protein
MPLRKEEKLHECLTNPILIIPVDYNVMIEPPNKYFKGKWKLHGECSSGAASFDMFLYLFGQHRSFLEKPVSRNQEHGSPFTVTDSDLD